MIFSIELEVRDYECDVQGIVNNAVYQNYFEHARHKFLQFKKLDFKEFTDRKINLVLIRSEIDYQFSLTCNNKFIVTVECQKLSKLKALFHQVIYLLDHDGKSSKVVSTAKFYAVAINERGRPQCLEEIGLHIFDV